MSWLQSAGASGQQDGLGVGDGPFSIHQKSKGTTHFGRESTSWHLGSGRMKRRLHDSGGRRLASLVPSRAGSFHGSGFASRWHGLVDPGLQPVGCWEISRLSFGTTAKPGLETFLSSSILQKQRLPVVSNPFAVPNSTPSIISLVAYQIQFAASPADPPNKVRLALRFPGCDLFPRPRKRLFFSRSIIFPPPLTAVPITDTTNSHTQPTDRYNGHLHLPGRCRA